MPCFHRKSTRLYYPARRPKSDTKILRNEREIRSLVQYFSQRVRHIFEVYLKDMKIS